MQRSVTPLPAARRVLIPCNIAPAVRLPPGGAIARLAGETMGTTWSVRWIAAASRDDGDLDGRIRRLLDGIVAQMSPWLPQSDISAFNRAAPGAWHVLPPDFLRVLRCALDVARRTRGAYDPTIGELVDLWGFGPPGPCAGAPGPAAIAAALARCGWERLVVDEERGVRQPGGLRLDLSSIAKGFAVDCVARMLEMHGIGSYLVEIGGELRGAGIKPDGEPWWVALEDPGAASPESRGRFDDVIALHDLAVATSGDAWRSIERDGRRWSHTIDPRTGHPVPPEVASVTLLHARCMEADALATALLVLGPDDGPIVAAAMGLAARFILRESDGALREWITPAFAAMAA